MSFAVSLLPAVAGHRWICVEGAVDATTAEDVASLLPTALRYPTRRLTLDLSQAHVVDEQAQRRLADIARSAARTGVAVTVFDGRPMADPHAGAQSGHAAAPAGELALV